MICKHKICAFSLLELILAIALGAILLLGIFQVYLSAKSLFQSSADSERLQENVRFASDVLFRNITLAGYSGCGKLQTLDYKNNTTETFSAATSVVGYTSAKPPNYLKTSDVLSGTDIIVIQKTSSNYEAMVTKNFTANNTTVYLNGETPASKNNRNLFISDCHDADLFLASNYTGTDIKVDKSSKITHSYIGSQTPNSQISYVSQYEEIAYFISSTTRENAKGAPIYGLYMVTNGGNKQELVEGINYVKIKYGIDLNGTGVISNYFGADEITSPDMWQKVLGVVITLGHDDPTTKMQTWDVNINLRERN
jgi:type IV pilus assembly protein PilW